MVNISKSASFLYIISILSIACTHAQELPEKNTKGIAKQITIFLYEGKNVKVDPQHLSFKWVASYNKDSKITEERTYNEKGQLRNKDSYKYDDEGHLIEFRSEEADGFSLLDQFIYDSKGHKLETSSFRGDGKLTSRLTYKVNSEGKIIEESIFGKDSILTTKSVLEYNENGKNNQITIYDSRGKVETIVRQKYDLKGNVVEFSQWRPNNTLIKKVVEKYTYYPSGSKKTHTTIENGSIDTKKTYHSKGNIIESIEFTGDVISKELTTYTKFDSYGNWLQRVTHEVGHNPRINVRVIEYY